MVIIVPNICWKQNIVTNDMMYYTMTDLRNVLDAVECDTLTEHFSFRKKSIMLIVTDV